MPLFVSRMSRRDIGSGVTNANDTMTRVVIHKPADDMA